MTEAHNTSTQGDQAIEATDGGRLSAAEETASIGTRVTFGRQQLVAAAQFARQCGIVETQNRNGSKSDLFFAEITSHVTATLFMAAASLEACINELFMNEVVFTAAQLGGNSVQLWRGVWGTIERQSALDKYQLALGILGKVAFTNDPSVSGNKPYVSAGTLFRVRNELVHFKPQWDNDSKKSSVLAKLLQNEQVSASPFSDTPHTFPNGYMSHDLSRWAVKTCCGFMETFSACSGLATLYDGPTSDFNPGYTTWPLP